MRRSLSLAGGAIRMGVIWAAGGAFTGIVIEVAANLRPGLPLASLVDVWPPFLALLGLLGGATFAAVLRVAEVDRGLGEIPLPRSLACGAISGLLLSGLVITAGVAAELLNPLWLGNAVIVGTTTFTSAVAAGAVRILAGMLRHEAVRRSRSGATP